MEKITKKLKSALEKKDYILFAYLFGSQATGKTNKDSDVDIAVYLSESLEKDFFNIRLKLIEEFNIALQKEVDVIILNTAAPFLRFVVIQEGKILTNRNPSKEIEFKLKSMSEYFDYKITFEKYYG